MRRVFLVQRTGSAAIAPQVAHSTVIAAPEAIPVRFSLLRWKMRMPVLIAVVHVWPAVIAEVLPRTFDSIVKALAL